ncbi:hypothetical protein M3Y95_00256000 [Aphelenchoides besseyi]|nr:hypothetical protein M3Y95_00256000 [Aphelenchoides besseyi]
MWTDVQFVASLLVFAFTLPLIDAQTLSGYALLDVQVKSTGFQRSSICVNFQQYFLKSLPDSVDSAPTYQLKWWNDEPNNYDVCGNDSTSTLNNNIIPMQYVESTPKDVGRFKSEPKHSFYVQRQMKRLIEANASAGLFLLEYGSRSAFHNYNYLSSRFFNPKITNDIPVFYMYLYQFEDLYDEAGIDSTTPATFRFYRPKDSFLDAGVFVLLLLTTGCIVVGSLWYTVDLKRRFDITDFKLDSNSQPIESTEDARTTQNHETTDVTIESNDSSTLPVSFEIRSKNFNSISVEVMKIIYLISGALAMTSCLKSLVRICIPDPKLRTPASLIRLSESEQSQQSCWIPNILFRPIRPIAFLIFCVSLAFTITWRLNSNHPLSFLMLDFMNVNVCVYGIKTSKPKSLRLITFFLIVVFVYDILVVFGIRLLTLNGCSKMTEIVTQMDCQQLRRPDYSNDWISMAFFNPPQTNPAYFYVPLLSNSVGHCFDTLIEGNETQMMLGVGDVIASGYLIAFAFCLDVRKHNRFYVYGFTTIVGYIFGMLSTFVSLKLMNSTHPGYMLVVPFMLIPLILFCLYKKTLRQAWYGNIKTLLNP